MIILRNSNYSSRTLGNSSTEIRRFASQRFVQAIWHVQEVHCCQWSQLWSQARRMLWIIGCERSWKNDFVQNVDRRRNNVKWVGNASRNTN